MPPTAEVTAEVSPARSYPELFRVTGPLLSLVFRTEDVWQRYNQFIETAEFSIRVSPSRSYNAGRAGLGWAGGWLRGNVYAASSDCVVVLALRDLVAWRHFVRASRGALSVLLVNRPKWCTAELGRLPDRHGAWALNEGRSEVASVGGSPLFYFPRNGIF